MFIIVSLLVGYSFFQAVDLFSQASRTALSYPEMASGMNPLEGIFMPTFGAYYLSQTLLQPFVVAGNVDNFKNGEQYLTHRLPESVSGKVGLWTKADNVVYFDDYRVTTR